MNSIVAVKACMRWMRAADHVHHRRLGDDEAEDQYKPEGSTSVTPQAVGHAISNDSGNGRSDGRPVVHAAYNSHAN